ncbi:unnamed protein product [Ectocarpus sp. 12 AP-2014]
MRVPFRNTGAPAPPRWCHGLPGSGDGKINGMANGRRLATKPALSEGRPTTASGGISGPTRLASRPLSVEIDLRPSTAAAAARTERRSKCAKTCAGGATEMASRTSSLVEDSRRVERLTRATSSPSYAELDGRGGIAATIDGEPTSPGETAAPTPAGMGLSENGRSRDNSTRGEPQPPLLAQPEPAANGAAPRTPEAKDFHPEQSDVRRCAPSSGRGSPGSQNNVRQGNGENSEDSVVSANGAVGPSREQGKLSLSGSSPAFDRGYDGLSKTTPTGREHPRDTLPVAMSTVSTAITEALLAVVVAEGRPSCPHADTCAR